MTPYIKIRQWRKSYPYRTQDCYLQISNPLYNMNSFQKNEEGFWGFHLKEKNTSMQTFVATLITRRLYEIF